MKKIDVFGSTGSVGANVLDVIENAPKGFFEVNTLVAGGNYQKLAQQINKFKPKFAAISDKSAYNQLKMLEVAADTKIICGDDEIISLASNKVDLHVATIVGVAGLSTTYKALSAGVDVALANKESLVCAGQILLEIAAETGAKIIPVDSEHNSLFQLLEKLPDKKQISKIYITASGGPFLGYKLNDLANISKNEALKHPTWSMGAKISVDSASLVNKGLEIIEAAYLFGWPIENIEAIIHKQSIIHGLLEMADGSIHAHLSATDMKLPIAHALFYPNFPNKPYANKLDLLAIGQLNFQQIDHEIFQGVKLAKQAFKQGQGALIAFNSANEVAVKKFLHNQIQFLEIYDIIKQALNKNFTNKILTISSVQEIDQEVREFLQ